MRAGAGADRRGNVRNGIRRESPGRRQPRPIYAWKPTYPMVGHDAVDLREIVGETFIIPSKTAPTSRAVIEDYLKRSGLDIIPDHEVDNITHAVSMIASTGAVALLPPYPTNLLPSSVTSRPIRGDAPTIDLVVGYNKANRSPILKLFLSRVEDLSAQRSSKGRMAP